MNKYESEKIALVVSGLMRQAAGFDDKASNPMQPAILNEAYAELAAHNRAFAAKLDAKRYDATRNTATR